MLYRCLRPIFFRMPPERAHHFVLGLTGWLQKLPIDGARAILTGKISGLHQEIFGIDFPTPLGLAAGLDKNASHVLLWQLLGFGFVEVGSVTGQPSDGNPQPRLFRLPEDGALINRMGLNNLGPDVVGRHIATIRHRLRIPLGINLAKTHDPGIMGNDAVADFVSSYTKLAPLASYVTLNVSCPNTTEGKTFEDPQALDDLLDAIGGVAGKLKAPPPLLVKLSPPASATWAPDASFREMVGVLRRRQVDGLIIANTASPAAVEGLSTPAARIAAIGRGGLSGLPLRVGALKMLKAVYTETEGKVPLVGVGGVDGADSAYAMIRSGASLVQLYTGLIYQGPGVIRRIHTGLVRRLETDGFGQISEAVGADV